MATADAVTTISESLKETDELPRKQIAEIVRVLGEGAALEILAEVRKVQDSGGVEVRDGTRRRTDGGVFFSLAKARLPKTDRNRIFRIRPPKAEGEEAPGTAGPTPPPAAAAAAAPAPRDPARGVGIQQAGRRRVVEVEVLRHHARPAVPPAPEPPSSRGNPVRQEQPSPRPVPEERPVRRIITVAAPVRDEAPATPDAAREKIRTLLRGLPAGDQRGFVTELLKQVPRDTGAGGDALTTGVDDRLRERVLAAVTEALSLTSGDLARALYEDDSPSARSKARVALERWRKTRG